MLRTRYALRGERGFRSYRSAAISNPLADISNLSQQIYRQKHPMRFDRIGCSFCRACGTAHADPVGQLHSQIRSTSAKQPPSLRGRRPWQSASPAVQRTARPRRGRKENGLPRAYALAMTAVDGSRCFCREIAVVASGRRGQCRTPYGGVFVKGLIFFRRSYGRSGRTARPSASAAAAAGPPSPDPRGDSRCRRPCALRRSYLCNVPPLRIP